MAQSQIFPRTRIIFTTEKSHKQETDEDGVPIYDPEFTNLFIPTDNDYGHYIETSLDKTRRLLDQWVEKRTQVAIELQDIASSLDATQKGCNISTVVGSSVGIAGGSAVIGGMILMPPVAVAGLVVGGCAAASNLITVVTKTVIMKKQLRLAKELLEEDRQCWINFCEARAELEQHIKTFVETFPDTFVDSEGNNLATEGTLSSLQVGLTVAAGVGARFAIREAAAVSTGMMRNVARGAAGIGIALDLISLIISSKDLANGSRSELAAELRSISDQILIELMDTTNDFTTYYGTSNGISRLQIAAPDSNPDTPECKLARYSDDVNEDEEMEEAREIDETTDVY